MSIHHRFINTRCVSRYFAKRYYSLLNYLKRNFFDRRSKYQSFTSLFFDFYYDRMNILWKKALKKIYCLRLYKRNFPVTSWIHEITGRIKYFFFYSNLSCSHFNDYTSDRPNIRSSTLTLHRSENFWSHESWK